MRIFNYSNLKDSTWDNEIINSLAKIHEYKGKQELFMRQKPVELERLLETAKIQSTEASNKIEGIITTSSRLTQIMNDKTMPKNRAEEEILGYRNVLNMIHENYEYISISPNYILQLHNELLKYTTLTYGGKFKTTPNEIAKTYSDGTREILFKPLEPFEVPDAMRNLCEEYNKCLESQLVDPLILIPCFILDFLCIHPFNDGNGRISRLLTLLLLYKSGFIVGKYISIEKAIEETKDGYYETLYNSDKGWIDNNNDPKSFIKYMLGIILSCYKEFEKRIEYASKDGVKSNSYDIVKNYVNTIIGKFNRKQVLINCPSIGRASVANALKKLTEERIIKKEGSGKATYYVRLK